MRPPPSWLLWQLLCSPWLHCLHWNEQRRWPLPELPSPPASWGSRLLPRQLFVLPQLPRSGCPRALQLPPALLPPPARQAWRSAVPPPSRRRLLPPEEASADSPPPIRQVGSSLRIRLPPAPRFGCFRERRGRSHCREARVVLRGSRSPPPRSDCLCMGRHRTAPSPFRGCAGAGLGHRAGAGICPSRSSPRTGNRLGRAALCRKVPLPMAHRCN
mmetsp:Transcript_50815/g.70500  ORF Transcript_50815/g.70500 Transcript_50815/m.70500 type:complete len:215 (+) Transcript_50815:783-1427(+)